eukprot:11179586-Ditylum_brightwellii.AAC.1
MGYLNGSIEDAGISKMLATTEIYDVMRSHHSISSPKSFINGSRAIGMILADEEITVDCFATQIKSTYYRETHIV